MVTLNGCGHTFRWNMSVRCFVAVECGEEEVLRGFRDVEARLRPTGADLKFVEPENVHLTLKFLGEIPEAKARKVAETVSEMSFKPFSFLVEGVGVFPSPSRPNVVWAGITDGVADLAAVFEDLEGRLSRLGFERERRRFSPHLTVCRVRSGRNRAQLVAELNQLEDMVFGSVKVDRVTLKKSVLTRQGPVYTNVAKSRKQ
jgi:2'-5' RNA ligase